VVVPDVIVLLAKKDWLLVMMIGTMIVVCRCDPCNVVVNVVIFVLVFVVVAAAAVAVVGILQTATCLRKSKCLV